MGRGTEIRIRMTSASAPAGIPPHGNQDGKAGAYAEFMTRGYHIIDAIPYGIESPPICHGTYITWQHGSQS